MEASLGFIGSQPSSYPVNTIYLWTSGPHGAVLLVSLKPERTMSTDALQETPAHRIDEVARCRRLVRGRRSRQSGHELRFANPDRGRGHQRGSDCQPWLAQKLKDEMAKVSALRDLQFGQALDTRSPGGDRSEQAGQLGVTVEEVGRSLVAATSSNRFVTPNYWADPNTGIAYRVQVEVPQRTMSSMEDVLERLLVVRTVPASLARRCGQVPGTAIGEYARYNQ